MSICNISETEEITNLLQYSPSPKFMFAFTLIPSHMPTSIIHAVEYSSVTFRHFTKTVMEWYWKVLCAILILYFNFQCHGQLSQHDVDPDAFLDSYQLIEKYGFNPQKHSVITEDGYVVNLFRLPRKGPPVLLVHGIADSSDSWLVLGPKESLAYLLAEAGFDVWLFNARGNKYSRSHIKDLSDKDYWDFSFEEIGAKDLIATVDYILSTTERKKISYVGFSQGTTVFLVMCSLRPEYNEKIDNSILLAPVAWMHKITLPYIKFLTGNLDSIVSLASTVGLHELYRWNPAKNDFHARGCKPGSAFKFICDLEYLVNFGVKNSSNISPQKFPIIASHVPAGTSAKAFVHFMQNYRSKRFARFDYGITMNERVYRTSKSPRYNVASVTAPVSLFASENDWFSAVENVQRLKKTLPNVKRFIVLNSTMDYTHIEFVYGSRVKKVVNDVVINILQSRN